MTRATATPRRTLLTADEREGSVLAVNSAFRKLKNLYAKIVPIFGDFRLHAAISRGHCTGSVGEDREGDHPTLRIFRKGRRALRSLPIRSGLGSQNLQGFRAHDQSVESDQRRKLHRGQLQGELDCEIDLDSLER